ncbi:hypothetical protein QO012_002971 [Methylobacterium aerolatum]|uniref:Growth inhibitor PemK n=1 Tax=Methylobacterium aerolatum TaxID=418708 RepID=A0ABU0I1H5_9HYPH|nr:hypothetical protein [Methylobacterium aerolatum]
MPVAKIDRTIGTLDVTTLREVARAISFFLDL